MKRTLALAVSVLALSAHLYAQGQSKPAKEITQDLSHAKQFAISLMIYLSDHRDTYPTVTGIAALQKMIKPYAKDDAVFKTLNPNGDGKWRFNMSLSGVNAADIPEPATTPLIFDVKPYPNGRRVVAFADGHAKLVTDEAWKTYEKNLKLKLKRQKAKK